MHHDHKSGVSPSAIARLAVGAVAVTVVSACMTPYSGAPVATNFENSKQHKLQAASHWGVIANSTADSLMAGLVKGPGCSQPGANCDRLYVVERPQATQFERAFRNQVITALVTKGATVAKAPTGATEVTIDVQLTQFKARSQQSLASDGGRFVSVTAVGTGLWALTGQWVGAGHRAVAGIGLLGAIDAANWLNSEFASGPTPTHEVTITLSATSTDRYLARTTNVYYVADGDRALYAEGLPLYQLKVVGDK
ncbi:MAG: hypothetical protein KF778_09645 [Rhodocyclaceae bacterium]|nr:hypothetical protein [Rhodocyclaceae bacterium]MBX3668652.1 hypothetical protein [Rhodocyclaceae bacterium]